MPQLPRWLWWTIGAVAAWWLLLRPKGQLGAMADLDPRVADALGEFDTRIRALEGRASRPSASVVPLRSVPAPSPEGRLTIDEAMGGDPDAEEGAF